MSDSLTRSAPNLSAIVRPEARDRFTGLITRGLTPQRVQSILDGAFAGMLSAQFELFDLMEDTWPRLKKNLNEIKRAVVQAQWRAEAACRPQSRPTERAEAKRDFLADAMTSFQPIVEEDENSFEQMIYDLCDAVGKGISVQEIHWRVSPAVGDARPAVLPRATRWIPSRCYGYPPDGAALQLCPDGSGSPGKWQMFPPDKFIVAFFKTKSGHPIGSSLLRSLATMWIGANFSYDWALNLAQLFGLPFRWVEYDPAQKGLLKQICGMLENMGSAGWGAFPTGTKLELHEAVKSAGASPQAYLMQLADTACDILLLGQTLTTESGSGGGSRALGEVHAQIREDVLRYIGHWAATALNYSLVPALMRLNFGDNADDPYFVCELIEIKDAKSMADRDAILLGDLGLAAPKKWFYERHGIPMPGPGDEVFIARAGQNDRKAVSEIARGAGAEADGAGAEGSVPINDGAAPVQAALAAETNGATLKTPFTLPLPASPQHGAPVDIQWMPPGAHLIRGTQCGQPIERSVRADARTADRLQAALEEMLATSARGEGDKPYFDFNHDDGEASAHPTEFYWAGDDPQTGGVRARLEWTAPGREAVVGRTFRRFSPSFYLDDADEVSGAPVNMGGLVNRAAFQSIQPIWTKAAAANFPRVNPDNTNKEETKTDIPIMKSLLAALANLGFITDAETDEAAAIVQINAKATALLNAGAELTAVRAQLQTAQDDAIRARRAHAESVVGQAVIEGRIPPRDAAVRARWAQLIEQDPANAALLPDPNPALRTVIAARQTAGVHATSVSGAEHPFLAKARELGSSRNLGEAEAVIACGWQCPELYEDYRKSLFAGNSEN